MSEQEQPKMQADDLYREESFTDRTVGSITRLTPVTANGDDDCARPTIYVGSAQMMTPAGALPLNFEIEAASLGEAAANFTDAARVAMEETIRELQELRREQASSIVLPGAGGGRNPGGMGGMGGGIQIP